MGFSSQQRGITAHILLFMFLLHSRHTCVSPQSIIPEKRAPSVTASSLSPTGSVLYFPDAFQSLGCAEQFLLLALLMLVLTLSCETTAEQGLCSIFHPILMHLLNLSKESKHHLLSEILPALPQQLLLLMPVTHREGH